jgi:hypothetical protein
MQPRYIEVAKEELEVFMDQLDWLNDGAFAYHLPRYSDLFSRDDFEKADKRELPIRIATHILNA